MRKYFLLFFLFASSLYSFDKLGYIERVSNLTFNPTGGEVNSLYIYILNNANVKIQIFDSSNRIVKEFPEYRNVKEGIIEHKWDGKNAAGKIAPEGIYKYTVTISDIKKNYSHTEETYVSIVTYSIGELPPVVEDIITEKIEELPVTTKYRGNIDLRADSTAEKVRSVPVYGRFNFDVNSQYKDKIFATVNLDLQSAPVPGSESVYMDNLSIDYNLGKIKTGVFYRKYIGFYDTPLRLFSSYRVSRDRYGVFAEGKIKNTYLQIIGHNATVENVSEDGIMLRGEHSFGNILKLGLSSVNQLRNNGNNNVMGIDADFYLSKILLRLEFAQAQDTQLDKKDSAYRTEFSIPLGIVRLGFNYQDIGQEFISYYSEIPVGNDTKGYEANLGINLPLKEKNLVNGLGMNLTYSNYNNHFNNAPQENINTNMKLSMFKKMNIVGTYSISASSTTSGKFTNTSNFINLNYEFSERLNSSLLLAIYDTDNYNSISNRLFTNYFLKPEDTKLVCELQNINNELLLGTIKQNYDILSFMLGGEKKLLNKLTVYTHIRISTQKGTQERSLTSIYFSAKYSVIERMYVLASYGSYADLENQNRFFLQTRIDF